MQIKLKYGCNPHQSFAQMSVKGPKSPLQLLNGNPSYINILDTMAAWQLARELKAATGRPGAASFKHVSPAGAAVAAPMSEPFRKAQMIPDEELSPVATAYARARGGDRMCSYGDVIGVSDTVDVSLAQLIKREVSDAIIAPGYEPAALEMLKSKKKGGYLVFQIDPDYEPAQIETREIFGFALEQARNTATVDANGLGTVVSKKTDVPSDVAQTLVVATIALKYTQSNSVCIAYDGQVIGMGAGQQSRVHCTRLACGKADKWLLQQHPRVLGLCFKEGLKRPEKTNTVDQYLLWDELSEPEVDAMLSTLVERPEPLSKSERAEWTKRFDGICLSSDAFIPFRDNIDRAGRTNVQYVLQAGKSLRDQDVTAAADHYGMVMIHSGMRWFLH